jgi:hypothetical protein
MMRRAVTGALLAGVLTMTVAARPTEPPPVDPELLEFLGSVDSEGEGWADFLGSVELDKRTPPAPQVPPAPPARKPEAAAPPVRQPVKGAEQ